MALSKISRHEPDVLIIFFLSVFLVGIRLSHIVRQINVETKQQSVLLLLFV